MRFTPLRFTSTKVSLAEIKLHRSVCVILSPPIERISAPLTNSK